MDDIQSEFDTIIRHRIDLNYKLVLLEHKLEEIKSQYTDLVKNNSKQIYLHCLDALFFQYKILRVEFEQYDKTITLIYNRMYGDYYKLYAIIQKDDGVLNLPIDTLPVYKDLELTIAYEIEDVVSIHVAIMDLLRQLHVVYTAKRVEIEMRNSTMCVGSSITGFIATLSHENKVLQQHISLYSEYLSFYHSSQRDYLTTLLSKINAFIFEIDSEILVNHVSNAKPDLVKEKSDLEKPSVVDEEEHIGGVEEEIACQDKSEAKEVQAEPEPEPEPEPKYDMQIEEKPIPEPKYDTQIEEKPIPEPKYEMQIDEKYL